MSLYTISRLEDSLFDQGVVYALSGDFGAAKGAIESLKQAGSELLAQQLQAVVYLEELKARQAVELLEPAVERQPNSVTLRALLTLAYDGAGDIERWLDSHAVLKNMQPRTPEDHMFAAIAYILDPERAVGLASKAFEQTKSPIMLLTLGRSRADHAMQAGLPGLADQAVKDVDMACGFLGDTGRAPTTRLGTYILAAKTHRAAGNPNWQQYLDEAADSAEVVLSKDVLEPWDRLYLAEYYYALDEPEKAWALFEDTSQTAWTDYHVFYYLALATELRKPYNEDVLARLDQEPLGPFSRAGRAFVLVFQGQVNDAVDAADWILARHHTVDASLLALSVFQLAGDTESAREVALTQLAWIPTGASPANEGQGKPSCDAGICGLFCSPA